MRRILVARSADRDTLQWLRRNAVQTDANASVGLAFGERITHLVETG